MHRNSPLLSLNSISKGFGGNQVLRDVSLDLYDREVLTIVGASGCGKTTLLKTMNLLIIPDQGSLRFGGKLMFQSINDVHSKRETSRLERCTQTISLNKNDLYEYRRNFGMVFQEFNLWPNHTLYENIAAPLKWSRKDDDVVVRERVMEVAAQVQIEPQLQKYPGEVSGGQKQRAGIARALVVRPKVLLLDEITSALDPELVAEMLALIESIREVGCSMIVVTHHMAFAASISNRVAFLSGGSIVELDTPSQFFGYPKSDAARRFLSRFSEVREY